MAYKDRIMVGGVPVIDTLRIYDKNVIITGRLIRTARIEQELCDDVGDPEEIAEILRQSLGQVDMFTFLQRPTETTPKYEYYMEWDDIAVLSIKSYNYWWSKQIKSSTRAMVRKAAKNSVVVREDEFNDDFVRGMVSIFNESPIRQGKPFWHYGKDFDTVKREFSRYLFRESLIGAYYKDELIGFMMLVYVEKYVLVGQIISKIEHRDKAPTNALMAKAVEICDRKKMPYLVYATWNAGSLTDFKRHNGFEKVSLPRYYVPLTIKGKVALKLGLHRRLRGVVPERVKARLIKLRSTWYAGVQTLKDRRHNAAGAEL